MAINNKFHKIVLIIIFLCNINLYAQVSPNKYVISFTDKNNNQYSVNNPNEFLSQRAIDRRIKQDINIVENDLPITSAYVDSLKNLGLTILNKSKWFNSLTIFSEDSLLLDTIENISFIKNLTKSASIHKKNSNYHKFFNQVSKVEYNSIDKKIGILDYGLSTNQIEMLNGQILHNQGYQGQKMQIAVIDAGFYHVNSLPAFDSLRINNQILGTKDFVQGDNSVYEDHSHGMSVLSILAGNIPYTFIGTAPQAKYWLLRSEDASSESLIEEENWASAAEFADSVGADVISSSLGYSTFDDASQSHTYADMDGKTTRISRAANIAASKGILVVNSAGNEGNKPWKYISAPSDADSVLCIGAVNEKGEYASFSSIGPTYDGRTKPNIVSQGENTVYQGTNGEFYEGNGTSFSTPIIAGLAACLWQAHPKANNMQIFNAIVQSSNHYNNPYNITGYGIPNFDNANLLLDYQDSGNENIISVYPNPFKDVLNFDFYSTDNNNIEIELYNILGQKISFDKHNLAFTNYNKIQINFSGLENGIYFLRVASKDKFFTKKVIKQ
ncbi:MAG: S8 family serine peptidase [Bacteroidetes bacterium]|nr:S8 family serine peptidase [Bacteroidota bacterium]